MTSNPTKSRHNQHKRITCLAKVHPRENCQKKIVFQGASASEQIAVLCFNFVENPEHTRNTTQGIEN